MFTRIVVGVDCREGGRDALALARCCTRRRMESSSPYPPAHPSRLSTKTS